MYSKSIPLGFFGRDSKSRDTALFASTVFESRGGRGFGKCSRDLDSVVQVGSDDVFLLGLGGSNLLALLHWLDGAFSILKRGR